MFNAEQDFLKDGSKIMTMKCTHPFWSKFEDHQRKIFQANSILGLLHWDMQTYLPMGASRQRGEQLSFLETQIHQLMIAPGYFEILERLNSDKNQLDLLQRRAVEIHYKRAKNKRKIPEALVRDLAETQTSAYEVWMDARANNDYPLFAKELKKLVRLKTEWAECLQEDSKTLYEVMLDDFEPEVPASAIESLFLELKGRLVPLVADIIERQKKSDGKAKQKATRFPLSVSDQRQVNHRVLEAMGFDFHKGRLDVSAHPFCLGFGTDTRMTTRYVESDWTNSLSSAMHEGGHALYEQGLQKISFQSLREASSYGVHESQSRFWENQVGKSHGFCEWLLTKSPVRKILNPRASKTKIDGLYRHLNRVAPSYIRVDADEVTYNLHILLRFEIEKGLFDGTYEVDELPSVWNEKQKKYLGLKPKSDSYGVLQDVHWSGGSFGYFPSYTLGNLIGAQLLENMQGELKFSTLIKKGQFSEIKSWLNQNVHSLGCSKNMLELVESVTVKPLSAQAFVRYLSQKFLQDH